MNPLHVSSAATLLLSVLCLLLIILDASRVIDLSGKWLRIPTALFVPNCALILKWLFSLPPLSVRKGFAVCYILFILYVFFRLHICPFRYNKSGSRRIRIMYGGRLLLKVCFWGCIGELLLGIFFFTGKLSGWNMSTLVMSSLHPFVPSDGYSLRWFWINFAVCALVFLWTWIYNGTLRILCTCRRLGIVKRIIIFCTIWIPLWNLFLMHYLCRRAEDEYAQECCRFDAKCVRAGNNICSLKYPLIMVHGIGFRDLRYFNYWGRIPKELARNGAAVYYGHQNAWGTIEENALALKKKIEVVCRETGAEKVNIIAHSKGGLDSRYLISGMGMADRIASLTTINTPHYGSELIPVLNRLPDGVYRLVASWFDHSFAKFGDTKPDCYHASKQLSPAFCAGFNAKYPDAPNVYYQSFTSVMKRFYSDSLLSIPYLLLKLITREANDGLVRESSAKWTNFRGTFRNKHGRGISHGDMIDLKREDFRGFDVIEEYIKIVSELKNLGY